MRDLIFRLETEELAFESAKVLSMYKHRVAFKKEIRRNRAQFEREKEEDFKRLMKIVEEGMKNPPTEEEEREWEEGMKRIEKEENREMEIMKRLPEKILKTIKYMDDFIHGDMSRKTAKLLEKHYLQICIYDKSPDDFL